MRARGALLRMTLIAAAAVAAPACDEVNPPIFDSFPIAVNVENGPLMAAARTSDSDAPIPVLLDTLTPLSVIDSLTTPADAVPDARRRKTTITLQSACPGANPTSGCSVDVPSVDRVRYRSAVVIDVHPCQDPGATCAVGFDGAAAAYQGIIGGDLLSQLAVRIDVLDANAPRLQMFSDIAGESAEHCRGGAAVIAAPLSGGATLIIDGGEVNYGATRVPLNACLDFDPVAFDRQTGTDLLLLLATGMGPSILSQSAYERYLLDQAAACDATPGCTTPDTVPFDALPRRDLVLPSGLVNAAVVTLPRIAIAGDGSERGPCEERRAAVVMSRIGSCDSSFESCPCSGTKVQCAAKAAVDLEPAGQIEFAVLPDASPLLQALREELRPGQPEVDGLLGMDAITAARVDIDYPNQRLLVRCSTERLIDQERRACERYTEIATPSATTAEARCPAVP